MRVRLQVRTAGKWQGKTIEVSRFPFLIGRDPACQLRPASPHISNRHCAILSREGSFFIRDLDSTNGTFLNDERIAGERPLATGDWLRVGPLDFDVALDADTAVDRRTPVPPTKSVARGSSDAGLDAMLSALRDDTSSPRELSPGGESVPLGDTAMDIGIRQLVESEEVAGTVALRFTDPKILDDKKVKEIASQLNGMVDGAGRRKLLLNMGNVRAMSATMAEQLANLHKKVRANGGQMILCNIHPAVFPVFQQLKLTKILTIHQDEQEALQAFR